MSLRPRRIQAPRRQRGAAVVEYTVALVLLAGTLLADPDVFHQLAEALRKSYAAFLYALSLA